MIKKKPPDQYKTLKIPLSKIINDCSLIPKFPVNGVNKLVIHVYHFLRLWIVFKFENNLELPVITQDLIKMTFKVFLDSNKGAKVKGPNLVIFNELETFYNTFYTKLGHNLKFDYTNISAIIGFITTDILTNIENNIKQRFLDHVKRFVNSYFCDKFEKEHIDLPSKEKRELKKEMKRNLRAVKKDLLEGTTKSDPKYHQFLHDFKSKLLPDDYIKSYYYDIECNPQKYLKYMFNINLNLEKIGAKQIQFFPLRTQMYPKYIPLDTKALIELFIDDKNTYLADIKKYKTQIWDKLFNLKHKIFKLNNYEFDYHILTDGLTVSLQFIHKDFVEDNNKKKDSMKSGRDLNKLYAGMSKDRKTVIKKAINNYENCEYIVDTIQDKRELLDLEIELTDKITKQLLSISKYKKINIKSVNKIDDIYPVMMSEDLKETISDAISDNDSSKSRIETDLIKFELLKENLKIDQDLTKEVIDQLLTIGIYRTTKKTVNEIDDIYPVMMSEDLKAIIEEEISDYEIFECMPKITSFGLDKFKLNINVDLTEELIDRLLTMGINKPNIITETVAILSKSSKISGIEFPYLEELDEYTINSLKEKNIVFTDPNKKNLLMMKDQNGTYYRYSNSQRIRETKRLKYHHLLKNYKDRRGITKIEKELSEYNSKSCNFEKFSEYVRKKNKINSILFTKYEDKKFRQYKWYGYLNRKRSDDNLLKRIKKTFAEKKEAVIIMGDWEISKQMRNFISTPNIRLKRVLAREFTVYNFDEYRTSCLNYKTEIRCENLKIKDKTGKERELHSVLTYQTESKRLGCINRDKNAVNNYEKIIMYWLKYRIRPVNYQRKWSETNSEKKESNSDKPEQVHLLLGNKNESKKKGSTIIVKGKKKSAHESTI